MNPIKMIRNLKTTERAGQTRLYFESSILEAANLAVGSFVKVIIQDESVVLTRAEVEEDSDGIISRRLRPGWERPRPYFDRSNPKITSVLRARERIDIIIRDGHITVRHESSFDLCFIGEKEQQGAELAKLRFLSLPSGMGMATAALVNTSLYEAVAAVDLWPLALDVYRWNFNKGVTLMADIKHLNPGYLPFCDCVMLSPECDEFSILGAQKANVSNGLAPHYARLVWASGAKAVILEQVTPYFRSRAYHQLRTLLMAAGFTRFYEAQIDAFEFGSVAGRKRGYAVAFMDDIDFSWPTPPKIPDRFRKTVGQVIGKQWEEHGRWMMIEDSPMTKLLNKSSETNNFNAANNHTLVDLDSTRMACIISAYKRTQITSSYLRHPDGKHWRHFTADELGYGFMGLPPWFEWPEGGYVSETKKVELIGQGVNCEVISAIGTEVAVSLMGQRMKNTRTSTETQPTVENRLGQMELVF
jgi:site-specific DNA-cytosine methylase